MESGKTRRRITGMTAPKANPIPKNKKSTEMLRHVGGVIVVIALTGHYIPNVQRARGSEHHSPSLFGPNSTSQKLPSHIGLFKLSLHHPRASAQLKSTLSKSYLHQSKPPSTVDRAKMLFQKAIR
jgi:hypothetical protein